MKKGYYIYVENCGSSGVKKKIEMQVKAFSKYFDIEKMEIKNLDKIMILRMIGVLPWNSIARDYETALKKLENPDFVYIRRTYVDRAYLKFLKSVKEKFPQCRVIVEIPTYPYKKEMLSAWYTRFMYVKELIYRGEYRKYIDRFVTYSDDQEICGISTICTMNGVDVDEISPIEAIGEYDKDSINLLAVALLARHHGYERIIKGLGQYYKEPQKRKVYFHIVGDGPEYKKYKKLVKKHKVDKYVKFYGPKYGSELDEIYNMADAGLAAFGVYKDGFSKLSTIKAREYLAKGIPVILGADDDLFGGKNSKYGLMFSNTADVVKIEKIIKYLDELYLGRFKSDINAEIRRFAYQRVDNSVVMQPIIDYIEK